MTQQDHERAHDLAQAVQRLNRRLRQERRSDLTPSQLSVLGTVVALGPATPSAIAARERVRPPTLTRVLKCLEKADLVVRAPHPDDGRQVLVSVAPLGEHMLTQERDRRDEWLAAQVDALSVDQRRLLTEAAALLEQLADA